MRIDWVFVRQVYFRVLPVTLSIAIGIPLAVAGLLAFTGAPIDALFLLKLLAVKVALAAGVSVIAVLTSMTFEFASYAISGVLFRFRSA